MMGGGKISRLLFVPLLALAAMVATAGYFMPQIREALFFKPQRNRVEAAVLQLAERERAFHHAKGRFETFGAASMDALQALAVDRQDWPSDNFQFDASTTPQKGLRVRALPRSEAVQGLHVAPQIFVAELAPTGGITRSGWVP
jgi:hypothetical protein